MSLSLLQVYLQDATLSQGPPRDAPNIMSAQKIM